MLKSRSWKTLSKKHLIVNILGFAGCVVLLSANSALPSAASMNTGAGNASVAGPGCVPGLPVDSSVLNPAEECRLWNHTG